MRTLKNLNERLLPVVVEGEASQEEKDMQPTFKKLYRLVIAVGKGSVDQAIDSLDLGEKLARSGETTELSESEYSLLKDRVRQNPTGLVDHFLGQLLRNLEK